MFQWIYPTVGVTIIGAVMLINDKPHELMLEDPCSGPTTNNYNSAPAYYTFSYFRSMIIGAAQGNVDNQ